MWFTRKEIKIKKFFEKNNGLAIVAFYDDNFQSLLSFTQNFFLTNKIKISSQNINFIIERCNGNRLTLKNELEKILLYTQKKSTLNIEDILKLINNNENLEISELADNCLAKNKKRTLHLLNENNYRLKKCDRNGKMYFEYTIESFKEYIKTIFVNYINFHGSFVIPVEYIFYFKINFRLLE